MPQADRACAGYVLEQKGRLSLIDCGGGVCSSFQRCGFDPLKVDRIFISHTHPDHCCELPLFIQMIYLAGRTEPLTVLVPEEFVDPLESFLRAVYVIPEKLPFDLQVKAYTTGQVYDDSAFRLDAIANDHLSGYKEIIEKHDLPNRMQCHSFVIETNGVRLLYSADLKSFDDIRSHLHNLDVVVIESTHIDMEQFMAFVPSSDVGRWVLTHLGSPAEVDDLRAALNSARLSNVTLAADGMKLEI
jgi:ribonuclease BN (tRNA processing enzyme)